MSSSPRLPLPGLRWRGLSLQLFLWVVLPLTALLLALTFGSLTLHQRAMRALVGERDERAVRTAAGALSEGLNHRAAAVHSLALRAADGHPPQDILASSGFLFPDFDAGLAFFSPQSDLLATGGDPALWAVSDRAGPWQSALTDALTHAEADPRFSAPVPHPLTNDIVVLVSATAGTDAPIVVGAFSPQALTQRILSDLFAEDDRAAAYLVSPDGQALYALGPLPDDLLAHPGVAEALHGGRGTTYVQVGESEHVIAYSPVPPVGWALVLEEPWESVATPLLNTTQMAPLVLVPVLLLALVALWFGARQIVQPLQALEARARELAWGDFKAIEESVGGIEEITRLQNTLVHLAHKVKLAQKSLRGYIGAITAGQEEERRRLARDLHDDTIQSLIALNQRVQLTRLRVDANSEIGAALEEIQALTEQTIADLRRLTRDLRPLYLEDLGLVAALEMLARETQQTGGLTVDFQRSGAERRLQPEVELALYRIAQEALSNVVRHAQAKHTSLSIRFAPDSLTLTIADDGRGFELPESPAEFAPGGHFGLLGLYERAELIGARLKIHSAPGRGTRLVVSLPLSKDRP